ncbi:LytR family transcriptional attenuator [Thermosporothrix hazakensis]|jgi:LCP family protein required for cell wall assembly|uniref:LytR family transcriptional attenuator n=2 Tax=Thermosporothrix TaxID=768650 RepID=A0A326UDZ2_THEHA|nr:LCP family protein [Thermosporothrix hazakensis]PZW36822.1 LytR family transcriptional attenuator [Thermosporothrix hazakensis]BBH89288.1 hypothetical protein KTC_40390 [Thermosporothrix sp. COM3]GCE47471.1 hypothetical protein KTH_23400 [Thermosporothrix hazakensis]
MTDQNTQNNQSSEPVEEKPPAEPQSTEGPDTPPETATTTKEETDKQRREELSQTPTVQMPGTKKKRKRRPVRIALTIFLAFLVLFGAILGVGYWYYYQNIHDPLTKFYRPITKNKPGQQQTPEPQLSSIQGRAWNLLLLGSDNDRKYTFPAVLTQVMMVVRIDPIQNKVTMLSIPRDSWVPIPNDYGMHKIDQAFLLGANQNNSFEDGVALAQQTVEKNYGIKIDRYGWIGLDGFANVIDLLGGVDIVVEHPIVDDTYPDDMDKQVHTQDKNAYKRLYIAPGPQHLNGREALEYVRSRHADLISDIGRTYRQQQVLTALQKKLNGLDLLNKLPELLKDLEGKVYTNVSEQEMLDFANFGRTLTAEKIQRLTLGPGEGKENYGHWDKVIDYSIGGLEQDVVIPHCENIQPLINRIFELGADTQSCNVGT